MHRHHRLIREAIAQRAAEVNRLAAQYEKDARGDHHRPALGGASAWKGRHLRPRVSVHRSPETVAAIFLAHLS